MTDRIEEIERRLRAAAQNWYEDNFRIALSRICGNQPDIDFLAHCPGKDGDVSFLLGEVRSLRDEVNRMRRVIETDGRLKAWKDACASYQVGGSEFHQMTIERGEVQSLALSLAEALDKCKSALEDDHGGGYHDCDGCIAYDDAETLLSDERLTKLREMKNV